MSLIKIGIQGGHLGVASGETGAPGEQELTRRIRDRLSQILISKGFQLFLFDANPPTSQLQQDFNYFSHFMTIQISMELVEDLLIFHQNIIRMEVCLWKNQY